MVRALETYRRSIDVYRQVIETRAHAHLARAGNRNGLEEGANGRVHAPAPSPGLSLESLTTLTRREQQVARLMARGYTNQQIANALVVARGTAANHVAHILAKLGLSNRTQVAAQVMAASQNGFGHVALVGDVEIRTEEME